MSAERSDVSAERSAESLNTPRSSGREPTPAAVDRREGRDLDLVLVDVTERVATLGWPPAHVEELPDGWTLRATPGLDRGRSCHALTPRLRPLDPGELPVVLERVRAWSAFHGIRGGLQISPLELHGEVVAGLVAAGWLPVWKCWVMVADRAEVLERGAALMSVRPAGRAGPGSDVDVRVNGGAADSWTCERRADERWLSTWEACQPRLDRETVDMHAATVFHNMGERGLFGRLDEGATGIAVEDGAGEWAGLFSLVVRPDLRGRGLGRRLVLSLLETVSTPRIYLQVTQDNAIALSLYESLGFRAVHSYQHVQAPLGWSARS